MSENTRIGDDRPDTTRAGGEPAWLSLERGEELDWVGGPRFQSAYPWIGICGVVSIALVGSVALGFVSALALLAVPVVVAPAVWASLRVARTAYAITTRRVAVRTGVLGVSVTTVGIERVQNTTVSQHPLGTLIGYGTVTIETAGGSKLTFRNVDAPGPVRDRIDRQRDRTVSNRIPGSREDWQAVHEEVRAWRRALERRV